MEDIHKQQQDERLWAMFCHLSALAGFIVPFGSVIGPLIVWSVKKDQLPAIDEHGKAALNFQLSIALFKLISIPLWIILIGIFAFAALVIFDLIMVIIASIKANNGEFFIYPLSIRFIK